MISTLKKLLGGYGSFFALDQPVSKALILACALLQPTSGGLGLMTGMSVIGWRFVLQFNAENERIQIINGILLGMLLGSLYADSPTLKCIAIVGGLLVVLSSAIISDTIGRYFKLPLLGLPYAFVAGVLLPLAAVLHLPAAPAAITYYLPNMPAFLGVLCPLGAMYFNGTVLGGGLVLLAFLLSSRYLAFLALLASACSSLFLFLLGIPVDSMIGLVARMNGVLSACIIGGLFAVPGRKSVYVSCGAAMGSCLLAIALNQILQVVSLPVLALPFIFSSYVCLLAFNPSRGKQWTYFWLTVPSLPESSLEQMQLSKARGVDYRSIALRMPLSGTWQVYQGFGGRHTHMGNWQYALDFFQTNNNRSFVSLGTCLTDYLCFGKPVLSPAFGIVVDCRADLIDNLPGDVDTLNNWGNYVLIRLDCGSYLLLAHLQQRSVKVTLGSRVAPGDLIAAVGNSGRSPQPHLHMHVQESMSLGSKTLPYHLTHVVSRVWEQDFYSLNSTPSENDVLVSPAINAALRRALKLGVGNRLHFEVTTNSTSPAVEQLEVVLDLEGQFWLESSTGARVAFSVSDELLAFYNRNNQPDALLDAVVLGMGVTPFAEGQLRWTDVVPRRLLPTNLLTRLAHAILYPISGCAQSSFKRCWDSNTRLWTQTAEHRMGQWKCHTTAVLCESRGLVELDLCIGDKQLMKAKLIGMGLKEDNGIPECTSVMPAA